MSKLSFRARALDASKPMPIYLAEELPDLPDYSAINRAVPQMPSGMEKEEESEHHLQRAISGTGLIIPTPEVSQVEDVEFYESCYPPDYKMPKQHMQPLWEEQEAPEYDIDTEDERWLKQQKHPQLTELKFEQMMDKLEKSSGQTVVTLKEAKLLLERQDDLVIAVYDYWLNKRLSTQHPLVLSVKTEHRPGQSTNNPYLAFRRRTEKMQTRKNRKNDESSYEKMLKLRRDLARALSLLELVTRRERAKRELVRLTALQAERRYSAGDFAHPAPQDTTHRAAYQVPITATSFRREYPAPYPAPAPLDVRQREKRPYKRRKHRHYVPALPHRDSGVCTSSEEEVAPLDDGPFTFRRKPGCFYEMPTATLYGDPVDPDNPGKDGLFQHELDEKTRFTLTSVRLPYPRCVGFARRRRGRGGRVLLDRLHTPLDDLWGRLSFEHRSDRAHPRDEFETKPHRTTKVMKTDYHSGGKYPWRHAFRRHLAEKPHLWTEPVADDATDVKHGADVKVNGDDVKIEPMEMDCERVSPDAGMSDGVQSVSDNRTIDRFVTENLNRVIRKRTWSGCSDGSFDSDEGLQPAEKEFEKFINKVNEEWLHFRPKTPPPSPPYVDLPSEDQFPLAADTPLAVELTSKPSSADLDVFTTSEFTLAGLYDFAPPGESFTEDREKCKAAPPAEAVGISDPGSFLSRGRTEFGSSRVGVHEDAEPIYAPMQPRAAPPEPPVPAPRPVKLAPVSQPAETHLVTVAVSDNLKVRLAGQGATAATAATAAGTVVGLIQNGPFAAMLPVASVASVASVANVTAGNGKMTNVTNVATVSNVASVANVNVSVANASRRVTPFVQLAPAALGHKQLQLHHPPSVVVGPPGHHVTPSKLKVLHAHPLTNSQRAQLFGQNRSLAQLPAMVSLAALGDSKIKPHGSVAQYYEIKGGQLGKPHLVNVLRQPPPVKAQGARVDLNDAKKRPFIFDGTLKGNMATATRPPHRVSVSLDGRQLVRASLPAVRAPHVRHQIQLKNRTLQVATPIARNLSEPSTSITIAPTKTATIASSVVANLLQKNVQLPKGQKIAISGPGGQALAANVQAIAFTTAQLKARQSRMMPQARPPPVAETSSAPSNAKEDEDGVRRTETLMEVT